MKNDIFIKINIILFTAVYLLIATFVCFGKRTEVSESERRKTLKLADYEYKSIFEIDPGKFLEEVFVDTIPCRDRIIDYYIGFKKYKGVNNDISIINVNNKTGFNNDFTNSNEIATTSQVIDNSNRDYEIINVLDSTNKVVVVGEGRNVRGLNLFSGYNDEECTDTASKINTFTSKLREANINANIYFMVIPLACAYYMPQELNNFHVNQNESIINIYSKINDATCVNIYDILFNHKDEEIYLRTDSHWSQRGAYYAGMEFAKVANVNYGNIDTDYIEGKVLDYCSSFYRYTEDQRFIDCHETFYYYEPKIEYTTTQFLYEEVDGKENTRVVENVKFFNDFSKTSKSYAYGMYMGGDNNTTIVKVNSNDAKRKLLLIKDSFGNCLAPNLFYSFDEVHVIDFRYFNANLIEYINNNGITDILLSSQISMVKSESRMYNGLLVKK